MSLDIVARAEDANADAYREVARRSGGRIVESDGMCLIFGSHPSIVISNISFRTTAHLPAEAVVERTRLSFQRLGRRPVLMTFERRDGDLDVALSRASWGNIELPVMVRTARLTVAPADGIALRWLRDDRRDDLETLRSLLRRGFAEDDEEQAAMIDVLFARSESIAAPGAAAVVATLDGQPAACAMVYRIGAIAVVFWVATPPEARRRGLGRLVTSAATNRGLELGAEWVTLQASPMGLPVYRAMGYETVASSRVWFGPPPDGR